MPGVSPALAPRQSRHRKGPQLFPISEAGPAALGAGDRHAERKGGLEPWGCFLFLQVPGSGWENRDRAEQN